MRNNLIGLIINYLLHALNNTYIDTIGLEAYILQVVCIYLIKNQVYTLTKIKMIVLLRSLGEQ